MDTDLFLQRLRELPIEDGRIYIQERIAELSDHKAIGELLEQEALKQLYTNPAVSLKLAELLIFLGELVHHSSSYALGLKAKGDVLRAMGLHQAALDCLNAAGEQFLHLGDEGNWARSRVTWIISCAWLGRVEEALQEAERAHDIFQRLGEYYWACVIDHNTAVILKHVGRYQEEIHLYDRMLAIYPTLTGQSDSTIKRAIALAEMNKAITLSWIGEFEEANHLEQKALTTFETLEETNLAVIAECNLGDFDYAQGYYGSALQRYHLALDPIVQNSIDDPMLGALLKLKLANCQAKLNRTQEACQLAGEAVQVYRQRGLSLGTGDALLEYASMLRAASRIEDAISVLDEAWTLFTKGGFEHHAAIARLQQADLLLTMGAVDAAYDQAHSIREFFDAQGLVARSVSASLVMIGTLLVRAQRVGISHEEQRVLLQEALSLCKQTAVQARWHNLQEEVYKSQYLLGQLFLLKGNPTKAANHYALAIAQIERILDDLVYDLSPSFLHTTWMVYEDTIALCLQQAQYEQAFSYLEQARSMALRQYLSRSKALQGKLSKEKDTVSSPAFQVNSAAVLRMQQELENWQEKYHNYSTLLVDADALKSESVNREVIQQELQRCEAKVSELFERLYLYRAGTTLKTRTKRRIRREPRAIDLTQLRQHLLPGQLMLSYFLYRGKLVIFGITAEDLITHEVLDGMEQLEYLLPSLHARLLPVSLSIQQEPMVRRLLRKLYDLLVAPVAALLPPSSGYLTIVPYGPLHKLPFHALYNGSRFLIEDFQINYLPTSNLLSQLGSRSDGLSKEHSEEDTPPGRPLIFGFSGNRQLQRALEEAKTLATMLEGGCYLESEATISRLIELAPGSPIIHLATHGQSRLDAPNFSSVLLADGQLNAIDAFSLNLHNCELVTLSGCETGLALSGGGDEQLGLGRAFLAAGATSLVMSLWSVEDQATSELMQRFYQYLLKGESKVQALRMAQRSLLDRTSSIYTHPYFWASFRLVGDAGPLRFQSAEPVTHMTKNEALKK